MHRCQRGALPASFITLPVNKTIFKNTTGNLNNERMFLFSTTFSGLLLSGPLCTKLFSNKILPLISVLQIVRFMVYYNFFLNLNFVALLFSNKQRYLNRQHISKRKKPLLYIVCRHRPQAPISNVEIENVSLSGKTGFNHQALE